MYEHATDILAAAGYRQYELSNWAMPGHESRHNSVYWRDGPYLGLGAGAHGYVDGERYENIAHPRQYIAALGVPGRPIARSYVPDTPTAIFDWITLRLRLIEGFAPHEFEARFRVPLEAATGGALRRAVEAGVLAWTPSRVALTRRGRLLHGELAAELLAGSVEAMGFTPD
jgi:oxygen-independent coproporphyrinogen-3 oxidase